MVEAWENHYRQIFADKGVNLGPPKETAPLALPVAPTTAMVPKGAEKDREGSLKDLAAALRERSRTEVTEAGARAQVGVGSLGPEFKEALSAADDVLANCENRRWLSKLKVLPLPGKRIPWESTWARSMNKHTPLAQANRDVYHV
mmetsp:Transcript_32396/g.65472  ORF Transcript_32396/g.65472 Transcript_32396/m.65472 type:complete len:145 (-) Transcript_32396:150-584(-)